VWNRESSPSDYNFPEPPVLFAFAILDFVFGIAIMVKSVPAGLVAIAIASVFALVGWLKLRRIIR